MFSKDIRRAVARRAFRPAGLVAVLAALASSQVRAQDVKVAGTDVPPPKRTKFVPPEYPAEAQAKGLRGIVILELVIDPQGHVEKADVVRSVPPFDEPALAAARKWEYEVTKVGSNPVSVRLTVPISFAMKLPEMTKQEGIPELRSGATPPFPPAAPPEAASVTAEVTLDSEGGVAEARLLSGGPPWSQSLLAALRTWRFQPDPGAQISFRVQADFVPAAKGGQQRVSLRLSGLRRSETSPLDAGLPETPSAPPATMAQASPVPTTPPTTEAPVATPPAAKPSPPPTTPPTTLAQAPPTTAAAAPSPAPGGSPRPGKPAPPVETITAQALAAGAAGAPAQPPASQGPPASAVDGVALAMGVPDLVRGHRPITPPFARMSNVTGDVEVRFAVDAAGASSVQDVTGPDLLAAAARATVSSWVFRRVSPERLHLTAVLSYSGNSARGSVKPLAEDQVGLPTAAPAPESPAPPATQPPAR